MNWIIESHPIDVAEISENDHQKIYLVNILDDNGRPIEAKEAYDQWKFKNTKKYRLQGIELPTSKIKRS